MKIAIFGPLCSGKSTLATHIECYMEKKYYTKVKKVSFGEMIYEIAYKLFDMKTQDRKLLQDLGRKMRDIDEDVFTKYTMRKIREMEGHILIEDARLISEFNALKEDGFTLINLRISREKQIERIKKTYPETWEEHVANVEHSSETELYQLGVPPNRFDNEIFMDTNEGITEMLIAMIVENALSKD
jgi:adenylate kinase family enzyme